MRGEPLSGAGMDALSAGPSRERDRRRLREVAPGYGPPRACFTCRAPVREAHFKILRKQVFHEACLKCGTCAAVLEPHETKVKTNRLYCLDCFKSAFLPACRACSGPVERPDAMIIDFPSHLNKFKERDPSLIAQAMFHADCLRCELSFCNARLRPGTAFRHGQRLFCSPRCVIHFRAVPAVPPSTRAPPSARTQAQSDLQSAPLQSALIAASQRQGSERSDAATQRKGGVPDAATQRKARSARRAPRAPNPTSLRMP